MEIKVNWDALGIATSIACAIHCAVLPVLLTSLPVFGINIIHNNLFEWSMIFVAFSVGVLSLFRGFIKYHGSYASIAIFSVGFIFLVLKQFFPLFETLFLSIAVLLIVYAHYMNYRLTHEANCTSPDHNH